MKLKVKAVIVSALLMVGMSSSTFRVNAVHTPLHDIIKSGNVALAIALCADDETWGLDWVNEQDEFGLTPLHYAAQNGNLGAVKFLIERGANVNARCAKRVYEANTVMKRWKKEKLLSSSWDWRECGCTPLHYAVKNGDLAVSKYLVEHGARVNMKNDFGDSAARYAFTVDTTSFFADFASFEERINMNLVQYLIEHNADINTKDVDGVTPLGSLREDYFFLTCFTPKAKAYKLRGMEKLMSYLEACGAKV